MIYQRVKIAGFSCLVVAVRKSALFVLILIELLSEMFELASIVGADLAIQVTLCQLPSDFSNLASTCRNFRADQFAYVSE